MAPPLRGSSLRALLAGLLLAPGPAWAQTELGGDVRYYQILAAEQGAGGRSHAELGLFRLKLTSLFADSLRLEAHGLVVAASPGLEAGSSALATGGTRRWVDLEDRFVDGRNLQAVAELDRLNLRWDHSLFRMVVGRQAMSWGVSYLWPVLDLFAPFPPQRIDREYRPGVDALRVTVPLGDLSEVDVVAAAQGTRLPEDFSLGGLGRFHVAGADLGLMAGRFHQDTVLGGFVTTEAWGTGIRGEIAHTDSGDEADAALGKGRFWRATLGLDRQLSADLMLTLELSYNGFGTSEPGDYLRTARADRVSRGEVSSLGRYYAGGALSWQVHPLVGVRSAVLVNLGDGSTLLRALAEWSTSENVFVLLGGGLGLGPGHFGDSAPGSEYGAVPPSLHAALKVYF